jgi:hypothetical protein
MNNSHACSFSSTVGELTNKQKQNKFLVLRALSIEPRVSEWDMEAGNLWVTIIELNDAGYIETELAPYPWHKYIVTELGQKILNV